MELSTDALKWPAHWPPTNRRERFFIGVRWLGPDLSFFKELRRRQGQRDATLMAAWNGEDRAAALVIGRAVTALGWRTPYFLPEDRLNVVLYGPRFQTLDDSGWDLALIASEEELGRQVPKGFWQKCTEGDISFGEFIGALVALPRGARQLRPRWGR